ncbi:MAG: SGNH/GDSL hydrolase family protein [Bilifractor sp.]|jgi:hypothetical protein
MNIKKISVKEKIGFAVGLVLLLLLGSFLLNTYAMKVLGTSSLKRHAAVVKLEEEKADTIDVLTIGDSESYTSISPLQIWKDTGYTVFVGGQSGQTMNEMLTMLETGLETQKPKVVLMETNALFRSGKDLDQLQDLVATRTASVFPIFQYHNLWKNVIIKPKIEPVQMNDKGFEIRRGIRPYKGTADYMQETSEETPISWMNQRIFDRIVDLCRERGIRLVLYSAPSPVNYNMKKHNRLERLASENKLLYVDMNLKRKEIGIDWSRDTLDGGDHLNISGAEKTTAYMESVLKTFGLTDHRKDASFQEWEELSLTYQKQAARYTKEIRKKNAAVTLTAVQSVIP